MFNLVLFGPPGSGKGTHAIRIKEKYNLFHFSTGEYLRAEINNKTELGLRAKEFINKGNLVPDDLVFEIIESLIEKHKGVNGFILDGFPRTIIQAEQLDKAQTKINESVSMVLSWVVDEDELMKRLIKRGEETGRHDDNEAIIKRRFDVYNRQTSPLIEYYKNQDKYYEIYGLGSVDSIFGRITNIIDAYFANIK